MTMSIERIDTTEFAPVTREQSEMVLGGLAADAAAADYCYTGQKTIILDGRPTTLEEWESEA